MQFIVTGRAHPERADINFDLIEWQLPNQGHVTARCWASQITIVIELNSVNDYLSAYYAAEQFAHISIGSLGFALGTGYYVELIQVIEDNKTPQVIGARPFEQLLFQPHELVFTKAAQLASYDIFFRLALRDYVRAITDAIDCATYCYRAIESLKSAIAFRTGNDKWATFHQLLQTDEATITSKVKTFADPVRHGNWISTKPFDQEARFEMLDLTRQILLKYLETQPPTTQQTESPTYPSST